MSGRSVVGPLVLVAVALACWQVSRSSTTAGVVMLLGAVVVMAVVVHLARRPAHDVRPRQYRNPYRRPGAAWPSLALTRRRPPRRRATPETAWAPPWARIRQVPDTADELISAWAISPGPRETR